MAEFKKVTAVKGLAIQQFIDDGNTFDDLNNLFRQRAGKFKLWKTKLNDRLIKFEVKFTVFLRRIKARDKSSIKVDEAIFEKNNLRIHKIKEVPKKVFL